MQSDVDFAGLLEVLLGRPSWHRDAACADRPDVQFIVDRGQPLTPAVGCLPDVLGRG